MYVRSVGRVIGRLDRSREPARCVRGSRTWAMARPRATTRRPSRPSTSPSATGDWCPGRDRHPRPDGRRALRPVPRGSVHPVRRARAPITDDVDVVIVGGGIAGRPRRRPAAQGGRRADPHRRPGRRHRRHLVLEPVPGRDVRRRVVHLPADARGAGLHPDASGTRSARRSGCTSQAIAERFDLVDRRALPHRRRRAPSGTRRRLAGGSAPTAATRSRARYYVLAVGILNLHEAAGHPGHGATSRASRSTPRGGTTTTPAAAPTSRSPKLGDKVVGPRRHRRERHPVPCRRWPRRPSTSTCSSARRRPSACGATGPTDPTFAEGLRARAGSRPGWTTSRRSCSAGRSTRTSSTTGGRTTTPRSSTRPAGRA